uniref:Uncharacterized protein n=1 Tax=Salix viminalis TaxID=40686 RepID=A0A6N2LJZ9_SALVM
MGNSHGHGHHRKFRDNGNVPFPDKTAAAPSASQPGPPFIYRSQIPTSLTRTPEMANILPYPHVDSALRALAAQAEGFGRSATGGLHGPIYFIYSQCNIYEAGQKKIAFKYLSEKAADKEKAKSGCIMSEGDLFVTGTQAGLVTNDGEYCMFHPSEYYPTWTVEPPTDSLKQVLQHCTGWQCVPRPADQPRAAQ